MGQFKAFMATLTESSLSRLYKHMQEHDSGTITAFRGNLTKDKNEERNYRLRAKLHDKRYDTTSVKGSCIENFKSPNAVEVQEDVFFVVDSSDSGNLEKDLRKLGEEYCQDFIMFIPKGGTDGIMWGTSKPECKSKNPYPKYGEKEVLHNAIWGKEGQFMTKVRGRPFMFEESYNECDIVEHELPQGYTARYGCHVVASKKIIN